MKDLISSLADRAAGLERDGVTRAVVGELAAAGLLAVYGPAELGGLSAAGQREVNEALAGASPDAWFVWFQHGPVVRSQALSDNVALQRAHLADLCSGRLQGGVAWSNLRTARPSVHAERVDGGWSLTGPQPWCTGWPMLDLVLVGALAPATGEVVFGIVPTRSPGLHSGGELALAAMGGTSTHAVRYDGLHLPDVCVTAVLDADEWRIADAAGNANVQPSTFGIALAALELLQERAPATAEALREQVLELRGTAYRLLDEVHRTERLAERLAVRARALLLGLECATALLASRGGQGMDSAAPEQRLLRAAAFQLVHSQDTAVRAATLAALVPGAALVA